MTPERFRTLTEAYGALPEHWPDAERAAALALLASRHPEALAALDQALQLDDCLDTFAVCAPDTHLIHRVMASAPQPADERKTARDKSGFWHRPRVWMSGGLIGAGAAGAIMGGLIFSMMSFGTPPPSPGALDQTDAGTVFSADAPDWSDQ